MRISRIIAVSCAAALLHTICLDAQITREKLEEDLIYATGVYHPYYVTDLNDTPAPKGYKPFYISHYGRHGSRYHTEIKKLKDVREGLTLARNKGLLTAKGQELLDIVERQIAYCDGLWGHLTELGGKEHREIAGRMYERFKPVWNSKDRRKVNCLSSVAQRCLTSELYSTNTIKGLAPHLDFSFTTGDRYMKIIVPFNTPERNKELKDLRHAYLQSELDYKPAFEKLFTDVEAMEKAIDPYNFCYSAYLTWAITEALDAQRFDLRDFMDMGEICTLSSVDHNYMLYANLRNSDWGDSRVRLTTAVLKELLEKIDLALADGSEVAADLRYGHDTGLMPLLALIGLKGYDLDVEYDSAHTLSDATILVPMGSNLQMVFYRSKREPEILVKFLVNEKELPIAGNALQAVSGAYYKWSELKPYLTGLL